jgi:hypothetical protein
MLYVAGKSTQYHGTMFAQSRYAVVWGYTRPTWTHRVRASEGSTPGIHAE